MRNRTQAASWSAVVLASLGLHALAFGGLGHGGEGARRRRVPTTVEMTVAPPKALPPPNAPRPAAARPRLAVARPVARARAVEAHAPAAEPPAAAEALADFTGQTLTNDGPGAGWGSATGNGQKMNGPVGRPGARVTHRVVDGTPGGTRSGPPTVGLGDLSRTPVAPDLTDQLAAAYPREARAKGLDGKAVVRARITPDGQVRDLAVVSETAPGFGAACKTTLHASAWAPPLDRNGQPVSTVINYTCRFNVH